MLSPEVIMFWRLLLGAAEAVIANTKVAMESENCILKVVLL